MSSISTETQYAFRVSSRELPGTPKAVPLQPGDTVVSFRGEAWTFEGVARKAYGSSTGRVAVTRRCPDAYTTLVEGDVWECPHMWHRDGMDRQELFPSVFNLYLGTENGDEA